MNQSTERPHDDSQASDHEKQAPARLCSKDLLQGRREVLIEHEAELYRLRVTRNGKLILHK